MSETKVNTSETPPPESKQKPASEAEQNTPAPTRYGDWEKNGRCIDF